MYASYFNLREAPFSILPDPRFLYLSRAHSMALSMLEYGVVNQAGFTVVTGEIGSGKTTLIRYLLGHVGERLRVGLINHAPRVDDNLFEWLLLAFDQPNSGASYAATYKAFRDFARETASQGQRVVLIVDEAQNLDLTHMEELRTLSNMNEDVMMFQLILVGQPQLSDKLGSPKLRQFAQRVSSDFHLRRLLQSEVNSYIDYRLHVAGGEPTLVSIGARRMIAEAATGVPRTINILADRCFAYAYGLGLPSITTRVVRNVVADRNRHGIFHGMPQLVIA